MIVSATFTGRRGVTWRYWPNQLLGTPGGFGAVYAAESADGMPMAVKRVPKQRRDGALDDRLLHREIDIGKRVAESGNNMLLPVIDAADDGESLLLVMARAEEALADTSTPKQEPEIVSIMKDIAEGLQQLHSIGIIHRDLKPANVLLHDGHWKLADFGIARDEEIGTQYPTFRGGGSPAYMAPEIWEGKSPTVKTDLYALGCTAFELLTGKPPYTGDTASIQAGHLMHAIPDAPARNAALKNLIIRLMAKNPGERPQDARAVLERLARAVQWLNPTQEAVAQSLARHSSETSREAAAAAAAKAKIQEYKQQVAQALADLREIVGDTLEELQNIEPEVKTGRPANNAISLILHDINITLAVWHDTTTTNELAPGDTMILAGFAGISNRHRRVPLNSANIAYEHVTDRFAWKIYRFPPGLVSPRKPAVTYPQDRFHGLSHTDFLDPQERYKMIHAPTQVWSKISTLLTSREMLALFQEAVDLRRP